MIISLFLITYEVQLLDWLSPDGSNGNEGLRTLSLYLASRSSCRHELALEDHRIYVCLWSDGTPVGRLICSLQNDFFTEAVIGDNSAI